MFCFGKIVGKHARVHQTTCRLTPVRVVQLTPQMYCLYAVKRLDGRQPWSISEPANMYGASKFHSLASFVAFGHPQSAGGHQPWIRMASMPRTISILLRTDSMGRKVNIASFNLRTVCAMCIFSLHPYPSSPTCIPHLRQSGGPSQVFLARPLPDATGNSSPPCTGEALSSVPERNRARVALLHMGLPRHFPTCQVCLLP